MTGIQHRALLTTLWPDCPSYCSGTGSNADHRYAYDDTPIYKSTNSVNIIGTCDYPEERAGTTYEIHCSSYKSIRFDQGEYLKDFPVLDKHGLRKYKKLTHHSVPLYDPPTSIGFIERSGGDADWQCNAFIPGETISDMITLLVSKHRPLYVSIHEVKEGRNRFVRSVSLQMSHPAFE